MSSITLVLIVDDDVEDKEFFREALSSIDPSMNCVESRDGEEALRMLIAENAPLPDLIFLDLNMPRMNGQQFLIELKKNKKLCRIPVIIYTTSRQQSHIQETRALGAEHFISKPYAFEDICREINIVLGKWDAAPQPMH